MERAANSVDHASSLYFDYLYPFGFEGGFWVLITPVPGHCIRGNMANKGSP